MRPELYNLLKLSQATQISGQRQTRSGLSAAWQPQPGKRVPAPDHNHLLALPIETICRPALPRILNRDLTVLQLEVDSTTRHRHGGPQSSGASSAGAAGDSCTGLLTAVAGAV
jgi:hypothetical protein